MKKYKIWTIKEENKKFVKTINLDHKYWSKIVGEKQILEKYQLDKDWRNSQLLNMLSSISYSLTKNTLLLSFTISKSTGMASDRRFRFKNYFNIKSESKVKMKIWLSWVLCLSEMQCKNSREQFFALKSHY
jgi:hypothetical protein